jgi:hypothetical protein
MTTEELREVVWEDLFRAKSSKSIEEVAAQTAHAVAEVRAAVNHEWFTVSHDRVAIAYAVAGTQDKRASHG